MDITDKWLAEIGGWQAMKAARALLAAGKVEVTEKSADVIRGRVGTGKSLVIGGLRFRSRSDVDNLCTCLTSRRDGRICEHSLAIALASLQTGPTVEKPANRPPSTAGDRSVAREVHLETGLAKGELAVFLPEGLFETSGAVGKGVTLFVKVTPEGEEESRLVAWLLGKGLPPQTMPLYLPMEAISELFGALVGHPRVFVGKPTAGQHQPIIVTDSDTRPQLKVTLVDAGDTAELSLVETTAPRLLPGDGKVGSVRWVYHPSFGMVHPWASSNEPVIAELVSGLFSRPAGARAQRSLRWLASWLGKLESLFQVELTGRLQSDFRVLPVPAKYTLSVSGSLQLVQLRVHANYGSIRWSPPLPFQIFPIADQHNKLCFYVQDEHQERVIFQRFNQLGFQYNATTQYLELRGAALILEFFASHLPRLRDDYEIEETDSWRAATKGLQRIEAGLQKQEAAAGPSGDWLTMEFSYRAPDGFRLTRAEALRLVRSGQSSLQGNNGKRYIIDTLQCQEMEEALQDVPSELTTVGARLSSAHESYFLPFSSQSSLAKTKDQLPDLGQLQTDLGKLGGVLRPYQLEGVAWLNQRVGAGQGALLGDDMGLGKTLQSIATLKWHLERASPGSPQQALIVCPKSLISNWKAEFERFAPELRVTAIQGSRRQEQFESIDKFDVLITSYQLLVRDLSTYQKRVFAVGVLDEASFVRNPDTDAAKALRSLSLKARIALSGTPVENSVRDLWSIFQIVLPGYLGNRQQFQERFEKPLQNSKAPAESGADAADRLKRLIRPFFLRRMKKEVLKDLPEKIEQILWCEMSDPQAEVYRRILEEGREEIRSAKRRSGQQGARMTMFTVLLRLRQTCCDLRLAGLSPDVTNKLDRIELSGKWLTFQDRLEEIRECGGKMLIFSQFVSYLRYCREILDEREVGFCYLDGSTLDRGAAVDSFQKDPKKQAFLISLKAGGYGLNLTQAEHVFLMDPWWNPAVEAQAIDRAHRFGQSHVVNAYRLVTRGTVEERIVELQRKKLGLIAATVEDRQPMMEGLSDLDLDALLEG